MNQSASVAPNTQWSLAIETSSRSGSIAVGRSGEIVEEAAVPAPRRHGLELLPTIARQSEAHNLSPDQLGRIYVSLGPGSFTGLRMGIAAARMLSRATGASLVGVPTLEVLARNALTDESSPTHVAACVRLRTDSVYIQLFERQGEQLIAIEEARECPIALLGSTWRSICPGPIQLYGELDLDGESGQVSVAEVSLRVPQAASLWALGESLAGEGKFTDPAALLPLYVRPPEAVEVWEAKLGKQAEPARESV